MSKYERWTLIILGLVVGWILGAVVIGIWANNNGHREGYEVGLCTFYVGVERGLTPEESRAVCLNQSLRENILNEIPQQQKEHTDA